LQNIFDNVFLHVTTASVLIRAYEGSKMILGVNYSSV